MRNYKQKICFKNSNLPSIPQKIYFTIGEVGKLFSLRPHVLRYWEQEFKQLSPSKRRGNRRYYQRKDLFLIFDIKELLYGQGYTIEGARQRLSSETSSPETLDTFPPNSKIVFESTVDQLESILEELES